MPMSNAEIAEAFREMGDLLEISGGNRFGCSRRVRVFTTRPAGRCLPEYVAGATRANGWR